MRSGNKAFFVFINLLLFYKPKKKICDLINKSQTFEVGQNPAFFIAGVGQSNIYLYGFKTSFKIKSVSLFSRLSDLRVFSKNNSFPRFFLIEIESVKSIY